MSAHCGQDGPGSGAAVTATRLRRFAVVGAPNSGKSTLFNALTGLHAHTGNYPGVTVTRHVGRTSVDGRPVLVEDLPGTYSLEPISPDEQVVAEVLDPQGSGSGLETPDALLVVLDATTLRRSLGLLARLLHTGLPLCVVLTFTDDLVRRRGRLDVAAFSRALGVPVLEVVGGDRAGTSALRRMMAAPHDWATPVVAPPQAPAQIHAWSTSVLDAAGHVSPEPDGTTRRLDALVLHPVWGTLLFVAVMFGFFQTIFTVAAPLQGYIESGVGRLGALAGAHIEHPTLSAFVEQALIGGVGGVLVFVPQITLLLLLVALLEDSGYLARAAFLMDGVMGRAGLEGRAFVALLSSLACAIPGIMATRSLPSAQDRLATMMGAPLMTCSARLPVYVLLVGLLMEPATRVGPFSAQGVTMFALYLLGAVSAMLAAWVFKRLGRGSGRLLPFYMEMPPYQPPRLRTVLTQVWTGVRGFLRKVTTIILLATVVLWTLLNLPHRDADELAAAGVDRTDQAAVSAYVLDHSHAATLGRLAEPVFEPLGFDWRINIGVISSLAAREVFVATLGQVAAAHDPEDPAAALEAMTVADGPRAGEPLFAPPTVAALLVFFMFALQCVSTIVVMRRETGTWRWPGIAFGYMFALAWGFAFLTHRVVGAFW